MTPLIFFLSFDYSSCISLQINNSTSSIKILYLEELIVVLILLYLTNSLDKYYWSKLEEKVNIVIYLIIEVVYRIVGACHEP